MDVVKRWFKQYFSDPQVVILIAFILFTSIVIYSFGGVLAPVLTSLVVAYLLQGPIRMLNKIGVPNVISITVAYILFLAIMILVLLWLIPELYQQIPKFFLDTLPEGITKFKSEMTIWIASVKTKFPGLISDKVISTWLDDLSNFIKDFSKNFVFSWDSIKTVVSVVIFIVLMPLLVFFFLKDKQKIIDWMRSYYPKDIELTNTVWLDLNEQIGNYVRGKIFEILVVWFATFLGFVYFDMPLALVLAGMVGLSVVVPYIGAVVVTIPVLLIAYAQFGGFTPDFWWVIGVYAVIQTIDAVVIVPLLFSEVVKLHPVAIVVAVLVFGGLWGFWGVFFAIPLASLVQAILKAWPRKEAETVAKTAVES